MEWWRGSFQGSLRRAESNPADPTFLREVVSIRPKSFDLQHRRRGHVRFAAMGATDHGDVLDQEQIGILPEASGRPEDARALLSAAVTAHGPSSSGAVDGNDHQFAGWTQLHDLLDVHAWRRRSAKSRRSHCRSANGALTWLTGPRPASGGWSPPQLPGGAGTRRGTGCGSLSTVPMPRLPPRLRPQQ